VLGNRVTKRGIGRESGVEVRAEGQQDGNSRRSRVRRSGQQALDEGLPLGFVMAEREDFLELVYDDEDRVGASGALSNSVGEVAG
jgi:hypothetical protein